MLTILTERNMALSPNPWGVAYLFYELMKNPKYNLKFKSYFKEGNPDQKTILQYVQQPPPQDLVQPQHQQQPAGSQSLPGTSNSQP